MSFWLIGHECEHTRQHHASTTLPAIPVVSACIAPGVPHFGQEKGETKTQGQISVADLYPAEHDVRLSSNLLARRVWAFFEAMSLPRFFDRV